MAESSPPQSFDFGIPPTGEIRELIRATAEKEAAARGLAPPLSLKTLEQNARDILVLNHLDPSWLAYAMIAVNNALWHPVVRQLAADDCLFLLPHCLRDKEACQGEYDAYGFVCADCHACVLAEIQREAENRGYTVMISEATGMVEEAIDQGMFEAVIGVGCLESLGKTFQGMLDKALPGLAVPLLKGGCEKTELDMQWLRELLTDRPGQGGDTAPFGLAAMRDLRHRVNGWFEPEALGAFLNLDGESTERLATHWVSAHGKRWRPYLMAASEYAMRPSTPCSAEDIQRLGVAIECFHKASLIHDDIEDEDVERAGHTCLHIDAGIATALNVGDFLIGEGYRLASSCDLPAAKQVKIIGILADCHHRLCLGQGREFDVLTGGSGVAPADLEELFALKTSPAFEAALTIGGILSDADEQTLQLLQCYSRLAGIAYQIKDDLGDSLPDTRTSRRSLSCSILVARWCQINSVTEDLTTEVLMEAIREDAIQDWARDRLLHLKQEALLICEGINRLPLRQLLFRLTAKLLDDTPV